MAVHADVHQHHQRQAQMLRVKQSHTPADDPGFFQRLHPAQARGGGQSDTLSETLIAESAVALEFLENAAVVAI
ncbi:hypothetical protein AFERRID_29830 [Acidithiobacillus ferridurans]|uniref:Uncharacterized protein n=1 Tax=Acidithiobacillus ferridurans TaxID=1232575 RepID=A0A2Z6IP00_ACIFI|nr:hypothetical protein AFERRID_29830 [Acidithiobacillus ferridurans]